MTNKTNTPAMLLEIDGEIHYEGNIASGVKTILNEAQKISNQLTPNIIAKGKENTIALRSEKPDNEKRFCIVMQHIPFKVNESSIIKTFDIPESGHIRSTMKM